MQHITYISQDDHYNLSLRYFEKNDDLLIEIPRYGTNKRTDDVYIAHLANDIARRKDQIKLITDSFRNHTRYKQIEIDGQIVVLENPVALLKRPDFANLEVALRDRKNEIRLKQAKLKRTAIKATAAIGSLVFAGAVIGMVAPQVKAALDKNPTLVETSDPSMSDKLQQIPEMTASQEVTPESAIPLSTTEEDQIETVPSMNQEEYVQPEPVVIPDEIEIGSDDVTYDATSQDMVTVSIPENDSATAEVSTSETNYIEFLENAYGMTENQIAEICNHQNLDMTTASFSSVQTAVSNVYWQNAGLFTPLEVSSSPADVEQEIYKAATAYGFTSDEEVATIIAISRLETGHYTSEKFHNLNNLGGVRDNSGNFIQYDTISQGAIGLAKSIARIKNNMIQNGTYNSSQSLATNIGPTFCPSNESVAPWAPTVDEIKNEMLSSGELTSIRTGQSQTTENQQGVMK